MDFVAERDNGCDSESDDNAIAKFSFYRLVALSVARPTVYKKLS